VILSRMALSFGSASGRTPTQGLLRSQRVFDGLDAHFRGAQLFEYNSAAEEEEEEDSDWGVEDDILVHLAEGKQRFLSFTGPWEQFQLWLRPILNERRLRAVVIWTSGGALLFAFSGASCGAAAGATVGAAVGTVPALLTFGLSIPAGIAAGGTIGGCAGLAASSSAGLVVGGVCSGCCTAALLYYDDLTSSQEQDRPEAMPNARLQVAAASAAGGALALGLSGGAVGSVAGGFLGGAVGIVPAFFTFGLSIPICAAVGSGAGFCSGLAVGGTTGLVSGGAAGYIGCKLGEVYQASSYPHASGRRHRCVGTTGGTD